MNNGCQACHRAEAHGGCEACGRITALWPLDESGHVRGDRFYQGAQLCADCFEWFRLAEKEPPDEV